MSDSAFDPAVLGARITKLREDLRLGQDAVAKRSRLSRAYISRLERGIVPSPKVGDLAQLASALGVDLADLVRQPPGARTDAYAAECTEIAAKLADEPPEVAETVLRWFRESLRVARLGRPD